jgi:hypothetical protein
MPGVLRHEPEIYGTTLKWTEKEISEIRKCLSSSFKHRDPFYINPYIENLNCYDLLREYL